MVQRRRYFFKLLSIEETLTKSIYLPNTCISEFPVSATKTFPWGSIAKSSGLLNCPSLPPLDPNLFMNFPSLSKTWTLVDFLSTTKIRSCFS